MYVLFTQCSEQSAISQRNVHQVRSVSKRTIANFLLFVIPFLAIGVGLSSCSSSGTAPAKQVTVSYTLPKVVGNIPGDDISESSGLAASKCSPNIFWTHNDSGNAAILYALDETGARRGIWKVAGAESTDWEDIAEFKDRNGKCFLYIGDIGDNDSTRREHFIYRVREPDIGVRPGSPSGTEPSATAIAEHLRFSYPDGRHDGESLLVHPSTGDIYVITKRVDGPAGVYRIRPTFDSATTIIAERLSDIKVPAIPNGLITGGDISPDGKRVILCDYARAYEYRLPDDSANFDDIWKQSPEPVDVGDRLAGEAVCYSADGRSIFATSERAGSPFIRVDSVAK